MIRSFLKDDKVFKDANQNGTESPACPSPNSSHWNFDKELEEWLSGKSLCHASSARGCNPREREAGQLACVHRWKVHTQREGQGQKDKQRQRECKNNILVRMWGKTYLYTLFLGIRISLVTMEVPQQTKAKSRSTVWSSCTTPGNLCEEVCHVHVYPSSVNNSRGAEPDQVPVNSWVVKEKFHLHIRGARPSAR